MYNILRLTPYGIQVVINLLNKQHLRKWLRKTFVNSTNLASASSKSTVSDIMKMGNAKMFSVPFETAPSDTQGNVDTSETIEIVNLESFVSSTMKHLEMKTT